MDFALQAPDCWSVDSVDRGLRVYSVSRKCLFVSEKVSQLLETREKRRCLFASEFKRGAVSGYLGDDRH